MSYLLDTSVCVSVIRERASILARLRQVPTSELRIASMTAAELWFGARKSAHPARSRAVVDAFLHPIVMLPFDAMSAEAYADARFFLEARGTPIGERDLVIAATGLVHALTVCTSNAREFRRVPGLDVEDWTA